MRGYQRVELHLHWRETFLRWVVRVGLESGARAAVLHRLDVVYPYGELEVLRRLRFAQTDVLLFRHRLGSKFAAQERRQRFPGFVYCGVFCHFQPSRNSPNGE